MGNRIDYFSSGSSMEPHSIGSLEHSLECDPAGAGAISKFARLHNAQFLSTYRSIRLHNSFTCMGNRIDYFSSGSSMDPHRASAHSSILWNVIQICFCSHFFEHRENHTDYFFRAGARTEPHQLGQISCSHFCIYRRASAYCGPFEPDFCTTSNRHHQLYHSRPKDRFAFKEPM